MEQLPVEKVPKTRKDGAKYRARQLFYQLPRQDFSTKYAKFLKEEAKQSFFDLSQERVENVVGIGMPCFLSQYFQRFSFLFCLDAQNSSWKFDGSHIQQCEANCFFS